MKFPNCTATDQGNVNNGIDDGNVYFSLSFYFFLFSLHQCDKNSGKIDFQQCCKITIRSLFGKYVYINQLNGVASGFGVRNKWKFCAVFACVWLGSSSIGSHLKCYGTAHSLHMNELTDCVSLMFKHFDFLILLTSHHTVCLSGLSVSVSLRSLNLN